MDKEQSEDIWSWLSYSDRHLLTARLAIANYYAFLADSSKVVLANVTGSTQSAESTKLFGFGSGLLPQAYVECI